MRLINSYTLEFHEFETGSCPPYAVLSHTWGNEEILHRDMVWLQDFRRTYERDEQPSKEKGKSVETATTPIDASSSEAAAARTLPDEDEKCPAYEEVEENSTEDQSMARTLRARHGHDKILKVAEHCRVSQIGYFWIDTCCIDKSQGFEVTEAVLSAWRLYNEAAVCFVYLADVPSGDPVADRDSVFRRSWWFTRGWTLVDLLAPTARLWFDQDWNFIFPESSLISDITGIATGYLEGADLSNACVAKRMSWAAHRNTTRREDVAYCLLGLFDVSMSILYGEGAEKAFHRLQRKILKTTVDTSIFAWGYDAPILDDSVRLLAVSPDEFAGCRTLRHDPNFRPMNDHFLLGPRGLELRSDVSQLRARDAKLWEGEFGIVMREFQDGAAPDQRIFIPLVTVPDTYDSLEAGSRNQILRRYTGSRPVGITPKAIGRVSIHSRRPFFFRGERSTAGPIINVLFTPDLRSTLPFRLVEVFPPHSLAPSAGGIVSTFGRSVTALPPPITVFLRYEENLTGASLALRRRFVVVLAYSGARERGASFEHRSSQTHVVDVTNSNLVSLCDEFIVHPEKARPLVWSRFLSSASVGDTLVSAGVETDSERWNLVRLHVRTAPMGSVADGVVSGDLLVAMAGARGEGERLKTPFD